ncbi:unnamed protein product [Enterobius vermicularis]|uniref:Insulin-degrading enzyme n=1 Tax=Enterobius vermicularis TaxID=51028 RepID=A0A0N4UWJ5_ENTVE|nr:unnamed protein product [Enterobius vermicularis]
MQEKNVIAERCNDIIKSPEDKRLYRGLELSNGLRMLLISDEKADKSAASMDVSVGHLMDPWELPGLAHFCEHMLFLGTDKFPCENEYNKYITSHGGATNAFTAPDHTNYHFDIAPEFLRGALDRFVQFFLCPQFTESATEREVCAVDSENSNNLQNDSWRIIQSLSKAGHDYGKFGTGSKKTLLEDAREKNIEPREALLKFHTDHYSSDLMSCCIIGSETLNELEDMVVSLGFGKITRKNLKRKTWLDSPYGKDQLGVKIELVPVKDLRHMTLDFPIPDYREHYRTRPTHYVAHLIGHEGPGSLLSELKRRGWVSNLSAGDRCLARGFGNFTISVDLSEEGLKHTDDIITVIFQEIGMIKSAGPLKWIQDELKKLGDIKFRFKAGLASDLQLFPMKDVIYSDYRLDQFDEALIEDIINRLNPDNMCCMVVSQKFANRPENVKEKWYGTEYQRLPIDKSLMDTWRHALTTKLNALHLPLPNDYIATKFDLKELEDPAVKVPRIILEDSWARVWFMQDNEYKLPKCFTQLIIHSPIMSATPMNSFLSAMFIMTLQDALAEDTYNPYLAGLCSAFHDKYTGISLRVTGYDEKQRLLVKDLINKLIKFEPDQQRYDILKENLCRALRCFRQVQPYTQAKYYSCLLLSSLEWTKEQLLACAEVCEVDRLRNYIASALQAVYLEMFVYGNMVVKEVLEMKDDVVQILKSVPGVRPLFASEIVKCRTHVIPSGPGFYLKESQTTHENSAVEFIMQTGVQNPKENVLLQLIVQLISEPAFNQLRTNEQLGYIVHTNVFCNFGVQALRMIVQGGHDPEFVNERIECFLSTFRQKLEEMPEEQFRENIESLAAKRLEKPKTLKAKAGRYWEEIASGFYHFDRVEMEVPLLRALTKEDVIVYFDKHFAAKSPHRRKLCTMVYADKASDVEKGIKRRSKRAVEGQECTLIQDAELFKTSMALYPLPQPVIDISPLASKNERKN